MSARESALGSLEVPFRTPGARPQQRVTALRDRHPRTRACTLHHQRARCSPIAPLKYHPARRALPPNSEWPLRAREPSRRTTSLHVAIPCPPARDTIPHARRSPPSSEWLHSATDARARAREPARCTTSVHVAVPSPRRSAAQPRSIVAVPHQPDRKYPAETSLVLGAALHRSTLGEATHTRNSLPHANGASARLAARRDDHARSSLRWFTVRSRSGGRWSTLLNA
jgi:hypothetical protein